MFSYKRNISLFLIGIVALAAALPAHAASKVTLEKDFGAGYYYDVIVEQATVVRQQTS